ncbi:MAG TPA: S8 family serine peptidase [Ktedonobacterales bacterium]
MADNKPPQPAGGPGADQANQMPPGAAPWQPAMPFQGGWPEPAPPDAFREYSVGAPWQPQPAAAQKPPAGYPQMGQVAGPPPGYSQPPAGYAAPGAPGAAPWQPAAPGSVQAPPAWPQGMPPGGWPPPEQPRGMTPMQPPPPQQNPRWMIAALAGLALIVVLVPIVLLLTSRGSSNQPTAQVTATPKGPTATPTAPPAPWAFTPAGTAPTSADCQNAIASPCYSPEQMQQAFGLTSLYKQGITGAGQTIVIIGAGNSPTVQSDLQAFDKAWGLPDPPSFKILQPFGPPVPYTCPDNFDGLQIENTLDVEWSHAMAPGANIVLVIGANNERKHTPPPNENKCGLDYLEDDVAYALDNHLGNIITISYGGSELGGDTDTSQDKVYEQQEYDAGHAVFQRAAQEHVTVMASSGDAGATNNRDPNNPNLYWNTPNVSWPASDPYVLAVGGTTLTVKDNFGTYGGEVAWNNGGASGGGISTLFNEPSYQQKVADQSVLKGKRGLPDVAFPADVNYALYLSGVTLPSDLGTFNPKWQHWTLLGGTSASSPCWAGIIALADQMAGQPLGYIQPGLYSMQGQDMHDITQGGNSFNIGNKQTVQGYNAGTGYDLVTGWGTPIADQLLPALVQAVQQVGNSP